MTLRFLLLTLPLAASIACGEGVLPEQGEVVYFLATEADEAKPFEIPDQGPTLTQAQISAYEPIVNGFLRNHDQLLPRADFRTQVERVESVFVIMGRYHELVAVYRKDYEAHGLQSTVADRLAWAYIRMGQRKKARALLDDLLRKSPEQAPLHFLDGAYWLQEQPQTQESGYKVIDAWRQAIRLDPNFAGFEGITAAVMQQQIDGLEKRLPPRPQLPEPPATDSADAGTPEAADSGASNVAVDEQEAPPEPPVVPNPPAEAAPLAEPSAPAQSQPTVVPATTEPKLDPTVEYKLLVAQAQIAEVEGRADEAERLYAKARTIDSDGFDARFGQLKLGWSVVSARNRIAREMRDLAKLKLTPRQAYDLAVFVWAKMSDNALARQLLQDIEKRDPAAAKRLQVAELLAKL